MRLERSNSDASIAGVVDAIGGEAATQLAAWLRDAVTERRRQRLERVGEADLRMSALGFA